MFRCIWCVCCIEVACVNGSNHCTVDDMQTVLFFGFMISGSCVASPSRRTHFEENKAGTNNYGCLMGVRNISYVKVINSIQVGKLFKCLKSVVMLDSLICCFLEFCKSPTTY